MVFHLHSAGGFFVRYIERKLLNWECGTSNLKYSALQRYKLCGTGDVAWFVVNH